MKEESRRRIARKFLEEYFGKTGRVLENIGGQLIPVPHPFELWREPLSTEDGNWGEARAFQVFYAPYISGAKKRLIAVAETSQELNEIVEQNFDPERIKMGFIEFETYKGYKIAYD